MMETTHMGHKLVINKPRTKGKPTISIDNAYRSRSKKKQMAATRLQNAIILRINPRADETDNKQQTNKKLQSTHC